MNLKQYFKSAISYDAYIKLLNGNCTLHDLHYRKFNITSDIAQQPFINNSYRILVITEPWCGDSLALLPIIRKLSKKAKGWDLRIILRDKNPELIDNFLTHNARAIPIFLFLDENYKFLQKWGPRPSIAQQIFDDHREQIQNGEIAKQHVIKKIRAFYAKDRGVNSVAELSELLNYK
jgi:thiol-disulfide isomerase/thioredoxin